MTGASSGCLAIRTRPTLHTLVITAYAVQQRYGDAIEIQIKLMREGNPNCVIAESASPN